ncbi:hypothetical protein BJP36_36685 [Moorena producens JHB]|uniref:Uncharacterized protein n=1 Tax=Moorena producens (strain JHB) TaxID=1454205 RepID=A0A9Q9UW92_MOOP1|nr:hypothetical protein [Moorena producens]WAN69634.1 hypothetical protein BJP36_36685 [Moorena producens JHB]
MLNTPHKDTIPCIFAYIRIIYGYESNPNIKGMRSLRVGLIFENLRDDQAMTGSQYDRITASRHDRITTKVWGDQKHYRW